MKTKSFTSILALLMAITFSFIACNKAIDETSLKSDQPSLKGKPVPVSPKPPYVVSADVTQNNTGSSIVCGGVVTLENGSPPVTERGVVWGSHILPVIKTGNFIKEGSGTGSFSVTITGLTKYAYYFVRAYAINSVDTAYGGEHRVSVTTWSSSGDCPSTFVDGRDGKTYKAVKMGDQCWMAENLNIGTMIPGGVKATNNGTIEKYCYNNLKTNCDVYGGLYQWDEMMAYEDTSVRNPSGIQGICPAGWHLPSFSEMSQLYDWAGGFATLGGRLKETGLNHWKKPNNGATNQYGFTSLGAGNYFPNDNSFANLKIQGNFWSTSSFFDYKEPNRSFIWTMRQQYLYASQSHLMQDVNWVSNAVRCIKDGEN